jgi:hypothetical protein
MALLKNRVGVPSGTVGAGAVALGAGLPPGSRVNPGGWKTFAEAGVTPGQSVRYLILDSNGNWEYGLGIYAEGTSTTFDPVTASDTILSNGNLTATHNAGVVNTGVKGMPSVNTGKYYFEITRNGVGSVDGLGLLVAVSGTYNNVLSGVACTTVFVASGNISSNGTGSGKNIGPIGLNSVVGLAVDFDARKAWLRRDGGNWNGLAIGVENPVTGVGGVVVAAALHFLPVVAFGSGVGSVYTANFGASGYANAPPAGFLNWPAVETGLGFDPATATSVTLSDGNLTVTGTGTISPDQGAKLAPTEGKTTGKYYFEQTIMALTLSPNRGAGIGTTASTYTTMGNNATTGVNMYPNTGSVYSNGAPAPPGISIGARAAGDVVGYAVDLDNRRIWMRPNTTGIWNGNAANNPETNVGGVIIPAGTMVPFCTFGGTSGTAGSAFKANFGASRFNGVVPVGFAAGWISPAMIPLSFDDPRFSANEVITGLGSFGLLANKTNFHPDAGDGGSPVASFATNNVAPQLLFECRCNSREGVRVQDNGLCVISGCWLESTGIDALLDHADTIQFFGPNNTDTRIYNTTIRAHSTAATAGLFWADNCAGRLELNNVLFWGGPYGCRVHADSGTTRIHFTNVFFVTGSFTNAATFITPTGGTIVVDKWDNVRECTIVGGAIVPGTLIPSP